MRGGMEWTIEIPSFSPPPAPEPPPSSPPPAAPPLQLSSPPSPAVVQRQWYRTSHTGEDSHLLISNTALPLSLIKLTVLLVSKKVLQVLALILPLRSMLNRLEMLSLERHGLVSFVCLLVHLVEVTIRQQGDLLCKSSYLRNKIFWWSLMVRVD
ncbi:zinc finger homeobox protein 3-like [Helianthus annuus]|uniref:zinc finger homeobox protein 3-like n=1 Tax=Helianthus annuus TaxID=4232 RepID=UPI001653240F|nr:zinc finger homeobox protein 3-like [Helianthus annuus]